MVETKTKVLEINQARIFYEEAGEGQAVILVHAGIADRTMWDEQFADLCADHRVIRYDLRGYGNSSAPAGAYSNQADLLGLMQALDVEKAVLMGVSRGGETVIDFAVEHPDMVHALIPVSAGLSGFEFEGQPPRFIDELEEALKSGQLDEAAEYATRVWYDAGRRPQKLDPQLRQRFIELAKGAFTTSRSLGQPTPLSPPAAGRLETLSMPTLVIAGELDDKNILKIASLLASQIPNAKQVIFTHTAHLPNLERPADFIQVVRGFLAGLDG